MFCSIQEKLGYHPSHINSASWGRLGAEELTGLFSSGLGKTKLAATLTSHIGQMSSRRENLHSKDRRFLRCKKTSWGPTLLPLIEESYQECKIKPQWSEWCCSKSFLGRQRTAASILSSWRQVTATPSKMQGAGERKHLFFTKNNGLMVLLMEEIPNNHWLEV